MVASSRAKAAVIKELSSTVQRNLRRRPRGSALVPPARLPSQGAIGPSIKAFEGWLRANGAKLDGVHVGCCDGDKGLGAFAVRNFVEGEVVVSVPRGLCIEAPPVQLSNGLKSGIDNRFHGVLAIPAGICNEPGDLLNSERGRLAVVHLAATLLRDRLANSSSLHSAYIALLPKPPPLHPLAFTWPDSILEKSPLLARLYRNAMKQCQICLGLLATEAGLSDVDDSLRRWALSAVLTRNFDLLAGKDACAISLVPHIDILNHCSPASNHAANWTCRWDERNGAVIMVAERAIVRGEELTHVYSEASDAALLCWYGIPPPVGVTNKFNNGSLLVPPSVLYVVPDTSHGSADPLLVAARAEVLRRQGWENQNQPLLFSLPTDAQAAGSLVALARLLALRTVTEIETWEHCIFGMGAKGNKTPRHRGMDPAHEHRSWLLITSWIHNAIAEMANDTTTLECTYDPPDNVGELDKAVTAILYGEAFILERTARTAKQKALAAELCCSMV